MTRDELIDQLQQENILLKDKLKLVLNIALHLDDYTKHTYKCAGSQTCICGLSDFRKALRLK